MILCLGLASACVSSGTYNKKVAELTKQREDEEAAAKARDKAQADQITKLTGERDALQKQIDDDTQLVATLKDRLEKLGQNVDNLVKERGRLTQSVADTTARLEELRKQKAAADARLATFRNLVSKLRSMIDAGQLKVVIRNGRMIIALPNDILFDSGKTEVKAAGKKALTGVAQVLSTVGDRDFLVAGHTDDLPIKTAAFPSNWELSTRRAVEVVHYLISQGMKPKVLAAAGYGEFDPSVPNDSPDHRAQNRRIEIVLQPNISDLPALDDSMTAPAAR
ncbi:MAG TPA: OmpA family protein [Kofleriaceae bacterium]|nr:OmpA family protein [Kofleriaceae bacterium]